MAVISCMYLEKDRCRCIGSAEELAEYLQKRGWVCGENCPMKVSVYTMEDRDKYLLKCMKDIKKEGLLDLCCISNACDHRMAKQDDEYAILYDACNIRLIQLHKRKYVSNSDYCRAYEQAKRLGLRLPGRSNKIYRRLNRK